LEPKRFTGRELVLLWFKLEKAVEPSRILHIIVTGVQNKLIFSLKSAATHLRQYMYISLKKKTTITEEKRPALYRYTYHIIIRTVRPCKAAGLVRSTSGL
jgi:hypothetical protein